MSKKISDFAWKINTIILDDYNSEMREKEQADRRKASRESKEFQDAFAGRKIVQSFDRLRRKQLQEWEEATKQNMKEAYDLIIRLVNDIDNDPNDEISFEDLKIVMHNLSQLLSTLKANSDKVIGQKKYGYYELMFKDLIEYDIRFVAFAHRELFEMPTLHINMSRLIEIGADDFTTMLELMKDNIRKNEGFKKNYLKAFKTAKEKLSTTINV
ncbi:MAG: hypothetical protein IKC49_01705 [Clostridia bacterium]|nr:hypothetical protein [Clostridia bacterium]